VSTDLRRIGEKARKESELVFTSLFHHVTDVDNLRACYDALPGNRAVGVDGVTMLRQAKVRIAGHLNYYAITDNTEQCDKYVYYANHLVFKWINRKSQRRAYTWAGFNHALAWLEWPKPRVRKDLNPFRRAEAR